MFAGTFLWNQKCEKQIDRLVVRGIEIDAPLQFNKGCLCLLDSGESSMRDGYTVAESCTSKALARKQGVKYLIGRHLPILGQKLAQGLKRPLFTEYVRVTQYAVFVEKFANEHVRVVACVNHMAVRLDASAL